MCGATAFVAAKALVRLRSSIRRQVASSVSRSEPAAKPPTAPTRMSTRPRATTVRSTKAVIAARSVTSTGSVTRRPRSAGVARSHSWSRSFATAYGTATTAPSVRNCSVTAWPRAPVPPVTIATRCCSGARAPGALGGWPETRCGPARFGMSLFIPPDAHSTGRSLGRRGNRHDRGALDLVVAHLGDVERLEVLAELLEGLLERRQRLARPGEGRGAGQHVVLHVRVVDAALLDLRHDLAQRRVGLSD